MFSAPYRTVPEVNNFFNLLLDHQTPVLKQQDPGKSLLFFIFY